MNVLEKRDQFTWVDVPKAYCAVTAQNSKSTVQRRAFGILG